MLLYYIDIKIQHVVVKISKKHKINLVSFVCKNALENKPLKLNGNNHNTKDGTPVRDYIHVCDLAKIVCDNTHLINEYGNFEFKSLEQIVSDEIAFQKYLQQKKQ